MELTLERRVDVPPVRVFDRLSDLPAYASWLPTGELYRGTQLIGDGPVGVGMVYEDTSSAGSMRGEVTAHERPTEIAFRQQRRLGLCAVRGDGGVRARAGGGGDAHRPPLAARSAVGARLARAAAAAAAGAGERADHGRARGFLRPPAAAPSDDRGLAMAPLTARSLASIVLAVAGPIAVWAAAWWGLDGWHDEEEEVAARNAGRVFNARVLDGGAAQAMDRLLAQREPTAIVLGPSYANTNVDPARLATKIGLDKNDVALMSVPNSVGAHWYAILKYRVFDQGYRPKLVVVVSGMQSMLLTTPLTESSFVNLEVQLPEEGDPIVDAKVDNDAGLLWARLREQRGKVRAAWFDWLRDAPLTAIAPLTPGQIRGALARVFHDENIDMRLHGSSTPVVEANRGPARVYDASMLPDPKDSFMGDISALAAEHGARVVWIRPPMSPHIDRALDDVVLPGVQERAAALVEASGGALIDLRQVQMTGQMFRNEDHMNDEGSRVFTDRIAASLVDLDALYPAVGPGGLPPLDATLAIAGDRAPEAPSGALWLAPGARAQWTIGAWEEIRGSFVAEAVVARRGGLAGAAFAVDGGNVWLRTEDSEALSWGIGRLAGGTAPAGSFTVSLQAPPDGPPLQVEALSFGKGDRRTFLLGDETAATGRIVELVSPDAAIAYHKPPVRVPGWDRPVVDLPTPVAAYDTVRWAFLSDPSLEIASGEACSPFRILEDGEPLPLPNASCAAVAAQGAGRHCHDIDQIRFSAPDGTDPAHNGRTYRIVLDPARRCGKQPFVYPMDELTVPAPPDRIAEIRGARWLTLDARYLNHREALVVVRLRADGALLLDKAFDGRELKRGAEDLAPRRASARRGAVGRGRARVAGLRLLPPPLDRAVGATPHALIDGRIEGRTSTPAHARKVRPSPAPRCARRSWRFGDLGPRRKGRARCSRGVVRE